VQVADLGWHDGVELGLFERLARDPRQVAFEELLLDGFGEILAHQVDGNVAAAESRQRGATLNLAGDLVETVLDLLRRDLDLERVLPGTGRLVAQLQAQSALRRRQGRWVVGGGAPCSLATRRSILEAP
jgi:hypothetical protein